MPRRGDQKPWGPRAPLRVVKMLWDGRTPDSMCSMELRGKVLSDKSARAKTACSVLWTLDIAIAFLTQRGCWPKRIIQRPIETERLYNNFSTRRRCPPFSAGPSHPGDAMESASRLENGGQAVFARPSRDSSPSGPACSPRPRRGSQAFSAGAVIFNGWHQRFKRALVVPRWCSFICCLFRGSGVDV